MPAKKYIVELAAAERERLNALISKGKAPAKTILKARILLKADQAEGGPGWLDAQIVDALDTNLIDGHAHARDVRDRGARCRAHSQEARDTAHAADLRWRGQAKLTALACSQPPQGHARWTIRLLAEHVVERKIVPAAHFNTVGRALKKTTSSRT